MVGIGVNVALRDEDFPPELAGRAGTLGLEPDAVEPTLERLLDEPGALADGGAGRGARGACAARDALLDRPVRWAGGEGRGAGIDSEGRLLVATDDGQVALDAGEVHLGA